MSVRLTQGDVVLVYTDKYGGKQGIGLIKYIGNIRGEEHIMKQYVGIELIEPISGGHNGCIDGIQYFQCKDSYGIHVLITNVIKILESKEIMIKLQEVIEMFKNKLSQYIGALNQRDSYISDLIETQKQLKSLISIQPNTQTNYNHNTTTPLTPIVDNNQQDQPQQNASNYDNLSYEQMLNSVDNAITSQSLAIKLDAKRINNEYQMKYQTPLTHKSNTTKSSNNYSPITATNTLDSGTPSSMTPAPKNLKSPIIKSPNTKKSPIDSPTTTCTVTTDAKTMLIHDDDQSISEEEEPDPLMTPTMDPIAETHSFPNPNHNHPNWDIRNNTMETRSPSQARLFNKESNAVSTLSGNSPLTPYGNNQMIYYPEYDVSVNNDNHSTTESYFSATSSTYNTPKSNTANGINTHAHAHGLLATWNARKLSKQSNRSKQSNEYSQPRLKSRENSKANKSSSRSKNKRENYTPSDKIKTVIKNVPHIYTGANTPALSANNDAILSGKAFETLPPISVPNKKQRDEYNKKHNILKNKRRKSKELKIKSNLPQMKQNGNNNNNNGTPNGLRNRSTSLIFTPSQLESAAKYSFRTIQEEPSPNNNSNSDTSSPDTPKFSTHHSTPIFHVNNPIANNLYYPSHNNNNNINNIIDDDIDNMTPELPPQKEDNNPIFYHTTSQRASLPPQQTNNILKSRYNSNQQQRSSLPPQQNIGRNNQNIGPIHHNINNHNNLNINPKHMSASSQINIAVPTFTFINNKNGNNNNHNNHHHNHHHHKQIHFQSLQNIHEHKHNHHINNMNNTIAYHQSAPQLDHWVDHQQQLQLQQQRQQQEQYQIQQQQIQNQRPFSAHEYEYDYSVPSQLPLMNNKAKSMPAPHQSFHIPSQQSIDMNPYIDAQFIGFQPQTNENNMNSTIQNIDMIEGVPIGPPIRRSPQSSRSPLNGPMPPQHNTNNNMAYSVHSGSSNKQSPHQSSVQSYNNNHNALNNIPKPIITNNSVQNVVLGKVQFAPRTTITKQLRRMSNHSNKSMQLLNKKNKVQRVPQSKTNVIKHSQQHKSQSQSQIYQQQQPQLNPQQMAGFTLTDAMYD